MELLVKEYLKFHTLEQLEQEHGVNSRPNATFDKVSLNYDQFFSKNGDRLSEQCRGLIIRPNVSIDAETWKKTIFTNSEVLAWPMNRFYNHGDPNGANVNWFDNDLKVYEKLDGTMIVAYWDPLHDRWHAATRAVPEADLPIQVDHLMINSMTFSGLFFMALQKTREEAEGRELDWVPDSIGSIVHLNKELTYVFELTTPYNRVVVKYDEPRVTLLAARHTATGKELSIEGLRLQHVRRPKTWDLKTPEAIEQFVNSMDPSELEGAVIMDASFNRLKVKSAAWVFSSRAKDMVSSSPRALECIIGGTLDDVVPLVEKDIGDKLVQVRDALVQYCTSVDATFARFKHDAGGIRKTFAELVMLSGDWHTPYFALLEGKATTTFELLQRMHAKGKLSSTTLDILLKKLVVSPIS